VTRRVLACAAFVCAALTLFAFTGSLAAQEVAAQLPAGYAGSEMCGVCHEDTAQNFLKNPHYTLESAATLNWTGRSCEGCHGPGAEHAETVDSTKIFSFKTPDRDRINQSCLACHTGEETHRGRLFGAHYRNTVDCLSCHGIHTTTVKPLLTAKADTLCSSCHVSERAAFNRPFRHKLQEGAIACVDCHNPHGGRPPRELRRVSANEVVCFKCHADKRGPFPFEHAPVKLESCSTCHEPHGSANPRMMARHNVSQLCLECHAGSMATLGGVPPAFHDLRSARFQNCTICHSKVHGSFVSRDLLR
jgi:DmsE family decaheme c-type cytochrome